MKFQRKIPLMTILVFLGLIVILQTGYSELTDDYYEEGIVIEDFVEMQPHLEIRPTIQSSGYIIEKFVDGLEWPTTMTFIDNDLFVLEKNKGTIRQIINGELIDRPILDLNVASAVEGGLLGISSKDDLVYLFLTESNSDGGKYAATRILQYSWDGKEMTDRKVIKEILRSQDGNNHHGGILLLRNTIPHEILAITGDNFQNTKNQNIHDGKDDDTGAIFDIFSEEFFAIGIRNSFGLTEDPITKKIWMTENGPDNFDEINLVEPKFNSGWKITMGPSLDIEKEEINRNTEFIYSEPEFSWEHSIGVTAISFVSSHKFPELEDHVLVGDFNNGNLYKFKLNNERTGFSFENDNLKDLVLNRGDSYDEIVFGVGFSGITDIKVGPDGLIYLVSIGDGTIYRIEPVDELNRNYELECEIEHKSSTDFSGCDFSNLKLDEINLSGFNLSNVDFSGSSLKNSILTNVNLDGANISNVDLSNSSLMNSIITNANLQESNLTNADMRYTTLKNSNLNNVIMKNTNISNSNLEYVQIINSVISNSNLMYVNFEGADFKNSEISESELYRAEFPNTNFRDSNFLKNSIGKTNFKDADFSGAKIFEITPYSSEIFNGEIIFSEDTESDVCLGSGVLVKILNRMIFEIDKLEDKSFDGIKKLVLNIC